MSISHAATSEQHERLATLYALQIFRDMEED